MEKARKIINVFVFGLICVLLILCFNVKYEILNLDEIAMTVKSENFADLTVEKGRTETLKNGKNIFVSDENSRMMVFLPTTDIPINCIKLHFDPDLSVPFSRLYYAVNDEGLIEENAMMGYIDYADYSIVFSMPRTDIYTCFRFDTWDAVDQYLIEYIEYGTINSTDTIYPIYNGFYRFNYWAIAILILLILILVIFEKKLQFFFTIKTISKKITARIGKLYVIRYITSRLFVSENHFDGDSGKSKKTGNIFAVLALVFGSLLIFVTPPMSGYDEVAHVKNVFNASSFNMFKSRCEDGVIGLYLSPAEINFLEDTNKTFGNGYSGERYNFRVIKSYDSQYISDNSLEFYPKDHGARLTPISYLYSSIGVMVFKYIFRINNVFTLYLIAKFSNLIFSVIVIRLALIKTPILRNTMFLLALMPMTIFQLCSITYDVGAIAGSFLLFAYVFKLVLADQNYLVDTKDIIAVCFACSCLFACKLIYIVSALILFAVSKKKFGSTRRYITCMSLVVLMGLLFYLIPKTINAGLIGEHEKLYIIQEQQDYIISHLDIIPTVIINNISLLDFLHDSSFFAMFGWEHAAFPSGFMSLYIVLLIIICVIEISCIRGFKLLPRLLSVISSLIIAVGILLSMYLGFTPTIRYMINIDTIFGVQGRYFIPVAIYIPLFLANPLLCKFKYAGQLQNGISFITKCTAAVYLLLTCAVIFTTYWM